MPLPHGKTNPCLKGGDHQGPCEFPPPPEPTSCPCTCHKPKHEARQPHPDTMAGRK